MNSGFRVALLNIFQYFNLAVIGSNWQYNVSLIKFCFDGANMEQLLLDDFLFIF